MKDMSSRFRGIGGRKLGVGIEMRRRRSGQEAAYDGNRGR